MSAQFLAERDGADWEDDAFSEQEELRQLQQLDPPEPEGIQPIDPPSGLGRDLLRKGLAVAWSALAIAGVVGGMVLLERAGRTTFAIGAANPAVARLSAASAGVMLLAMAQTVASLLLLPRFGRPRIFDRLLGLSTALVGLVAGSVAVVLAVAGSA